MVSCDICNKHFTRQDNLQRHKRKIHKQSNKKEKCEPPPAEVSCNVWQKKFSRQGNLQRHKQALHEEVIKKRKREWKCRHCFDIFDDYSSLFLHVNENHPINQTGGRILPHSVTAAATGRQNELEANNKQSNKTEGQNQSAKDENDISEESALQHGVKNKFIYPKK